MQKTKETPIRLTGKSAEKICAMSIITGRSIEDVILYGMDLLEQVLKARRNGEVVIGTVKPFDIPWPEEFIIAKEEE